MDKLFMVVAAVSFFALHIILKKPVKNVEVFRTTNSKRRKS
jgi:hypothetical protein